MAAKPLARELLLEALDAQQRFGSIAAAAKALGMSRQTLDSRLKIARAMPDLRAPKPFEMDELPDELPTADELLERRSKHFVRKRQAIDARALIPVRITCNGPF